MKSNNLVILRGNLGAEPELRALPGGDRVANLRVATSAVFRGPTGDKVERTDWHRVDAYGPAAEYAHSYLHKGDTVIVMGAIRHKVVEGPAGTKTTYTSIRAHDLQGLGKRVHSSGPPGTSGPAGPAGPAGPSGIPRTSRASPPAPRPGGMPIPHDDLPF